MRKRIIRSSVQEEQEKSTVVNWLNIDELVEVEISSEDEAHPVEYALLSGSVSGWRAAESGEQTIRLVFNHPVNIKRIMLKFDEPDIERTQEYVLRWSNESGELQEIVKQQWNFSPDGATKEIENHHVDLPGVKILELTITPDISGGNSFATLDELRVA
jgi:hypothetical protein